jgi:hypothetical protein
VKKLSNTLVQQSLLAESAEKRVEYKTQKTPNTRHGLVRSAPAKAIKTKEIAQPIVPTSVNIGSSKTGTAKEAGGIPQSKRADKVIGTKANLMFGKSDKEKSPKTPAYKKAEKTSPAPARRTVFVKKVKDGNDGKKVSKLPVAKAAYDTAAVMPTGAKVFSNKKNSDAVKKRVAVKKLGDTAKLNPKEMKAIHKNKPTTVKRMVKPDDSPKKVSWRTKSNGINVVESVQVYVNGKPKAKFGIINSEVATKLVERYESFGFDVTLHNNPAAWKSDAVLLKAVFESVDAEYNNAPSSSKRARSVAMNRFFELARPDYNNLYESKQQFAHTVKSAFNLVMERADAKYRKSLHVLEGVARVELGEDIIDIDLITQARNTDMAIRNFRNEIVEEYGFSAKIKHIFIEGKKFTPANINEWSSRK